MTLLCLSPSLSFLFFLFFVYSLFTIFCFHMRKEGVVKKRCVMECEICVYVVLRFVVWYELVWIFFSMLVCVHKLYIRYDGTVEVRKTFLRRNSISDIWLIIIAIILSSKILVWWLQCFRILQPEHAFRVCLKNSFLQPQYRPFLSIFLVSAFFGFIQSLEVFRAKQLMIPRSKGNFLLYLATL